VIRLTGMDERFKGAEISLKHNSTVLKTLLLPTFFL